MFQAGVLIGDRICKQNFRVLSLVLFFVSGRCVDTSVGDGFCKNIFLFCLSQAGVVTAWLVMEPPATEHVYPTRMSNLLICRGSNTASYFIGICKQMATNFLRLYVRLPVAYFLFLMVFQFIPNVYAPALSSTTVALC